jgi:hypothetical protein
MAACHRVFSLPELAEAVFLRLPMRDLLCGVIQTSQNWKEVVDASLPLQRALFQKPSSKTTLSFFRGSEDFSIPHRWATSADEMKSRSIISHPMIHLLRHGIDKLSEQRQAAFVRPKASWRHCLATQPPATGMILADKTGRTHYFGAKSQGLMLNELLPSRPSVVTFQ